MKNIARSLLKHTEWVVDDVLKLDVSENGGSDPHFFPFDELMENLVKVLTRDPSVFDDCVVTPQIPFLAPTTHLLPCYKPESFSNSASSYAASSSSTGSFHHTSSSSNYREKSKVEQEQSKLQKIPPSGIVPFQGFSAYAAPFCYLSMKMEDVYPLYQAFYCRHLCKLHTISMERGTLLPLLSLFETLFCFACPFAAHNLMKIGSASCTAGQGGQHGAHNSSTASNSRNNPNVTHAPTAAELHQASALALKIVLPWIVKGFVGFLHTDEVLYLWDRVWK